MSNLAAGARQLAPQHVSIRVPWHDSGWNGTVCRAPLANTSCMVLVNIGEKRNDAHERACAGQRLDRIRESERPPCVAERATFMADFEIIRTIHHVYAKSSAGSHGHLQPITYTQPPFSAPAIPFDWLLRERVEGTEHVRGLADLLQLGYDREREPVLDFHKGKGEDGEDLDGDWVNALQNQVCLLDTFYSAVQPHQSLCFFYAKRTPLAPDDGRRVILGVGVVTKVGGSFEYPSTEKGKLRSVTFERNVHHSIRPSFDEGFLMPYQAVLAAAEKDAAIDPASCVAFASDEDRVQFSYVTAHVSHDAAIGTLLSCARALHHTKSVVDGPWDRCLAWIDRQLNLLWKMRGPCPGLGSALTALGVTHGTLVAQDIAASQARTEAWNEDPWQVFEQALEDPSLLSDGLAEYLGADVKRLYKKLAKDRRSLLKLLSRFALTESQTTRFYQPTERKEARIEATDAELLQNPYLLYELDRTAGEPVALAELDRGLFPDPVVRAKHPLASPSALEGPLDARRVRAFVVDALERAADDGHTLQQRDQVIQSVRSLEIRPEMPLSEDILGTAEETLEPFVTAVTLEDGRRLLQLDRFVSTRDLIRREITKRREGKRHTSSHGWSARIQRVLGDFSGAHDTDELRARTEKAAALEELFSARMTVLQGPAGTGKTTLLKALCDLPEVQTGGVLLLAPTGKARVRMESQTEQKGAMTVAQFLLRFGRYDGATGRYFVDRNNPKRSKVHRTVIIDECSMLTEEQLAAVLDAISGVERLILVGDPRQLPPIGSGRPFVDIVSHLSPPDLETRFPRVAPSYAELTVTRRQKGAEPRDDLTLAHWFSGRPVDPGADEIWERQEKRPSKTLRLVRWDKPEQLEQLLLTVVAEELELPAPDDENAFEESLGGGPYEGKVYFRLGAAAKTENWQILSPLRAGVQGVEAINRLIQKTFRTRALAWAAEPASYRRKIPSPMGPEGLLYGDKVISVVNGVRRQCWPKPEESPYVANGDIGIAIGDYKPFGQKRVPKNLVVEFVAHRGVGIKYFKGQFGDEGTPPLELAYALTVHKTQGSEFGLTFVIVPNPCRLLSRELLYTALTRQKDKVVLLHQGEVRDLLRFSDGSESEVARRCTNLLDEPRLVAVEKRFLEDRLIHRTARGERVRSKSEVILADKLHHYGLTYDYECAFVGADGKRRWPDFTIEDAGSGVKVLWEHLGMLSVPGYRESWERKRTWYAANGVLSSGGPNGTLVVSEDSEGGGIDSAALDAQIRKVFSL